MIIIVALIFVGPKRIPEFARSLAKVIRDFVRTREEIKRKLQEELKIYEEKTYLQIESLEDDSTEHKPEEKTSRKSKD